MTPMAVERTARDYDHHRGSDPLLRPTSRIRAGVFLAVNLIGYAAVNAFWQYLTTGRWVNLSVAAYRRDLITPLGELFVRPLNVLQNPWMILVTGLLLGVVVFVPVVVSVLYRLRYAGAFVALVAVVGHAPVLAVALGGGCVLSARTRLRSDMPFLAAMLGLVPIGLYLYFFGFAGMDAAAVLPLQRWVLYGPVALAIVAAVVASALVLVLAGWTGFRPGVVWPVLVLLLAGPLVVFYTRVGPVRLDYAVLVIDLAPGEAILDDVALSRWTREHGAEGLNRQTQLIRVREDLQARRRDLVARCDAFGQRYPADSRAPAVLWIRAQCESLQLDERAFERDLVRYSSSHPLAGSEATWRRLVEQHPASPQAALGKWRLAQFALRVCDPARADELLEEAAEKLAEIVRGFNEAAVAAASETIFRPDPAVPGVGHYREALAAAEKLIWLIRENDAVNNAGSAEALSAFAKVNPRSQDYSQRLGALAGAYEKTPMGDNLKLAVAQATGDLYTRAEMLILLAELTPPTDAAIEANYELGRVALRTSEAPAIGLLEKLRKPESYFKVVVAARPNPWQELARRQLKWLRPTTRPGPAP